MAASELRALLQAATIDPERAETLAELETALRQVDAQAMATAANPAVRLEQAAGPRPLTTTTGQFNLRGLPANSALCGFGAGGLSIGLQPAARACDEATPLAVANAYQRAAGCSSRRPPAVESASRGS
jgi:Asp-tRNA(Asn)/Glu-tRNA(Gln) amidotransferase A subunit family amidase